MLKTSTQISAQTFLDETDREGERIILPGLVLVRFQTIPEKKVGHYSKLKTEDGHCLVVADLNNEMFPLRFRTTITEKGVYYWLSDFDAYYQDDRVFLVSSKKKESLKYDDPPGRRISGLFFRDFREGKDIFSFSN